MAKNLFNVERRSFSRRVLLIVCFGLAFIACTVAAPNDAEEAVESIETVSCKDVVAWQSGLSVRTGDDVQHKNQRFTCLEGGWCSQGGPYEPGVGWAWKYAWKLVGQCGTPPTGGSGTGADGAAGTGGTGGGNAGSGSSSSSGASGGSGGGTSQPPTTSGAPAFCQKISKSGDWTSSRVSYGSDGKLRYASDAEKNRIVDFSYSGYRYGEVDPPQVAEVMTLSPTSGDQTKRIQDALDAIGSRGPNSAGFRGALLLKPGRYEINGTIRIRQTGVVLRGSGDGVDTSRDTLLVAKGDTPHQRSVVIAGSGNGSPWRESACTPVADAFVQVGSRSVSVDTPGLFKVGGRVIIKHPSTQAWTSAVNYGGVVSSPKWSAGSHDIPYYRRVTRIDGNKLTFDAPIYNHLDKNLASSRVCVSTGEPVYRVGVENLRVDIETRGGEDENHAWNAIGVVGAEDAWVRNVTALHFGHAGVFTQGARLITVVDAVAIEPVGIRTGGRFYNFDAEGHSQLVLFKNCEASGGRHNMISNGTQSASGIVFYRIKSSAASASEGHRHWSQALLFDNITDAGTIQLINRGDFGSSHGWGSAHSVIWNDSGSMNVQKPPTAQNYAISSVGKVAYRAHFPGPAGFSEVRSGKLAPQSLYEAQLCERLGF